jgi:TPP-dependent pyruvate/acetoin dehydrogenase alpha subunit
MKHSTELLQEMYYVMKKIRRFEETGEQLYKRGVITGMPIHLCIGMEATATGVCLALSQDDYITSTHRGHGHLIAKGGDIKRLMAELCGRSDGYCKGKGGTMHAADLNLGILGANGIVGGGFGIATGAALSAKKRKSGQVSVCFFGDGAANQGIFMEVMNMANLWQLPVIYVCENNTFAEYSRGEDLTANRPIGERATALGIPALQVDGNDVLAVYDATTEAVKRARVGGGPGFIEARSFRFGGHHVGEIGFTRGYRTAEEVEEKWKQEPIARFRTWLTQAARMPAGALDATDQQIEQELEGAVDFAMESPLPALSTVTEDVYA